MSDLKYPVPQSVENGTKLAIWPQIRRESVEIGLDHRVQCFSPPPAPLEKTTHPIRRESVEQFDRSGPLGSE